MGFKISIVLGILLLLSVSGSFWYIDRLQDNISTLKANSMTLEAEIKVQNEAIKNHLEKAKQTQEQVNKLTSLNRDAERQVNKLRTVFARHDLDNLALAKPELVQGKVNKGTLRVKNELIEITDPDQFDKDETSNTN